MDDIKDIAAEKETPIPALESKDLDESTKEADEVQKKEDHLANVKRAIAENNEVLRKVRADIKLAKTESKEEEIPTIDLNDPSAKAWDKHIRESVSPLQAESEAEKKEIRTYAFQEFLKDKPALVKNPERMKELTVMYEKIRTATERTTQGVLLDLNRAYAALYADELIATAKGQRIDSAQAEAFAADIAVSRGASTYQSPKKTKMPELSDEDKEFIRKAGYASTEDWWTDKQKYGA